jgi:hypothetical protein
LSHDEVVQVFACAKDREHENRDDDGTGDADKSPFSIFHACNPEHDRHESDQGTDREYRHAFDTQALTQRREADDSGDDRASDPDEPCEERFDFLAHSMDQGAFLVSQ